jgi:glycosyltransferase involved in cell wall biosynthesis
MTTVCLAVMAKDEAQVIARCLASAKPLVDAWIVLDTGSTDATMEVARETMKGLPGEVIERPWRGFGASRTESLELARSRADYVLVLDADDQLEFQVGARFPELTEPGYSLMVHDAAFVYPRIHLMKSALPWRYEAVCHEYATCEGVEVTTRIEGIIYRRLTGGARSRDPQKYLRDAALLEEDLRRDPDNARSVFYLGRSYFDAGVFPRALAQFERRLLMGGWDEELFLAAYAAATTRRELHFPNDRVAASYLEAWNMRPHRAEPLYFLATLARESGDWLRARGYALAAAGLPFPRADRLPVHHEIYAWRALDEVAAACVGMKDWPAAIEACTRLLSRDLPPAERARIEANLASCEAAARAT